MFSVAVKKGREVLTAWSMREGRGILLFASGHITAPEDIAPIEADGKVVAVLALYRTGQDGFTHGDLHLLEEMGCDLGGAIAATARPKASGAGAGAGKNHRVYS